MRCFKTTGLNEANAFAAGDVYIWACNVAAPAPLMSKTLYTGRHGHKWRFVCSSEIKGVS